MSGPEAPLLHLDGLSLAYGDAVVVRDVSLAVQPGEILAIMGPNGAGKTTVLNGIVGLARTAAGTLSFDGELVKRAHPERAAAMGIAYVPQGRWLFPYATGRTNLWSGGYRRKDQRAVAQEVEEFIAQWPVAARVADRHAAVMSGGEQQVIAIGRGILAQPRLLLVDEPSLGLAPILVKEVFALLRDAVADLARLGTAVILVEQNIDAALSIADRVCIMSAGAVVHQGVRGDLSSAQVGDLYLH